MNNLSVSPAQNERKKRNTSAKMPYYQRPSGKFIRTIGIKRAKAKIGLMNLAHNLKRFEQLVRLKVPTLQPTQEPCA